MVELMVAMLIINMVIFAMFFTITLTLKASKQTKSSSEGYIVASSILNEYIEQKIKMNLTYAQEGNKKYGDQTYSYIIEEKNIGLNNPDSKLMELNVTVTWDSSEKEPDKTENKAFITTIIKQNIKRK